MLVLELLVVAVLTMSKCNTELNMSLGFLQIVAKPFCPSRFISMEVLVDPADDAQTVHGGLPIMRNGSSRFTTSQALRRSPNTLKTNPLVRSSEHSTATRSGKYTSMISKLGTCPRTITICLSRRWSTDVGQPLYSDLLHISLVRSYIDLFRSSPCYRRTFLFCLRIDNLDRRCRTSTSTNSRRGADINCRVRLGL